MQNEMNRLIFSTMVAIVVNMFENCESSSRKRLEILIKKEKNIVFTFMIFFLGILNNLGLNMSTYVNMAIKQLINKDGVPFEVVNPKPSKELVEAINEGEAILDGKLEAKSYTNMYEMLEDLKA